MHKSPLPWISFPYGSPQSTEEGSLWLYNRFSLLSPLQYSCLENPMDRGARWATVQGGGPKESDTTEQLTLSLQHIKGGFLREQVLPPPGTL